MPFLPPAAGPAPVDGAAPADGPAPVDGAAPADGPAPAEGAAPADGAAPAGSLAAELVALGHVHGLDAVGIAAAEPFTGTRHELERRRAAGLHGGMQFTFRNPARSTNPSATLPGARSLVVGARAYREDEPDRVAAAGRVARYAWRDHYGPLRAALGVLAERLGAAGWRAHVVADDNALVDREAAYRAGLGWYGKNANLLLPRRGSWFVLGSVITDAPLPAATRPVRDGCGTCRACLDACPTGAIVAPGVVDARRCLAWLVQQAGTFPVEYRAALGERLYGCDDCQEVCPPNQRFGRRSSACDGDRSSASDGDRRAPEAWVPVLELLAATDADLLARHGRWYIPRREPRWLRRNALVVLGNVGHGSDPVVAATLARYLADPDPMLRAHAVWAAARVGRTDLLVAVADDEAPEVVAERTALAGQSARPGQPGHAGRPGQPGRAGRPGQRGQRGQAR